MEESGKKSAPYTRYAFANAYNLSLLGGAAAIAAITGNWFVGVAAAGAEALWMLYAPGSRLLRKLWFDKHYAQLLAEAEEKRVAGFIGALPEDEAMRCMALRTQKDQIDKMCVENPAFTQELLRGELDKLDSLVKSYIDMSGTCVRYLDYLKSVDLDSIERDIRRYSHQVDNLPDSEKERKQIALKNLGLLQARKAKVAEIRQYLITLRGQQDLIENTFKLLADQILTMRSPQELSGQLDDLMDGVEAVRQTARETEKILQAIEH